MRLKFFARAEHVVHFPAPRRAGQIHNYVGRQFVAEADDNVAQATRVAGRNIALKEGFEIDSETPEARDLMHEARCGGLWCADAETAQAVGIVFTPLRYDEQAFEFIQGAAPDAKASKPVVSKTE